jgi:hypothetical protein
MGHKPVANKIIFHSNKGYNKIDDEFSPSPAAKVVPKWYMDADLYAKDPRNGKFIPNYDGGKLPTFRACPAILDLFTTGYVLQTPCDLEFYKEGNTPKVKVPKTHRDFCDSRPPMPQFVYPSGYEKHHFHWWPNWAPSLPEGYSALYVNPLNSFDLPFLTVAGIIDNDKFNTPGLMPFFIREGFEGVVKAGTPFVQIIPFKREDWEMELKFHTQEELLERHKQSADTFRKPDGGVYKKSFWTRRKYK